MAKNSHFRVLALTATPGGTPEAVQDIVDACHISRIEIRDEDSLDLKEYLHRKVSLFNDEIFTANCGFRTLNNT
jgi:ATP-dependent DNA helicase MPH1